MKNRWFNIFWATIFAFAIANCANSDFAGTAAKKSNSSAGLRDGADAADASDGGPDSGGFDSGDGGRDSGGPDSGGGYDSDGGDNDGDDFGGDSDGGSDSDGDDDDGGDDDLGIDGGDQNLKTRHDMIINRTREDEDTSVTISLLDNDDDEVLTKTVKLPKKGQVIIENACRTNRLTRIRLSIQGDDLVRPGDKCYFEKIISDREIQIDVDTNGAGFLGTCKPGEDETFTIKCPQSDELEIDRF